MAEQHRGQYLSWELWELNKETHDKEMKRVNGRLDGLEKKYNALLLMLLANLMALIFNLVKKAL